MKIEECAINELSARIYLPEKVKKILIGIHGFAGDKESSVLCALGKQLPASDVAVIIFDLPNHGTNKELEPLSHKKCIDAVAQVVRYVKKRFSDKPISFFATSFGAYLLLNFLQKSKAKFDTIILRAPGVNMKTGFEQVLKDHKNTLADLKTKPLNLGFEQVLTVDYSFYESLTNIEFKNLQNRFFNIIQGKKDEIINLNEVKTFFETYCKNNYKIFEFENADHRFKNKGEFEKIIEITKGLLK